jgi:site-specific DNA recombinase
MKKAIIYIRVSTDEQAERGHSLAYQEDKLRKYCELKNIEVVQFYKDDHSAKTFDRPAFNQLLENVKKNKQEASLLLFIKWDRFSRNTGDAYYMINVLNRLGVEPQAIEQPLDLNVPENKIMLAFYLASPEVENDRRALNVISGMRRARKEGRFLGMAPKGYLNQRDEANKPIIVPDPISSSLIREAFEQVAQGTKPVFTILEELQQKGLKCSKSNMWHVLTNPVYYGGVEVSTFKDEPYEIVVGRHEAIITQELFENVQDVLFNRKRKVPVKNTKKEELPLRGLLKCKVCGGNLTGSASKNRLKQSYFYYHCRLKCNERFRAELANDWILSELKKLQITQDLADVIKKNCKEIFTTNEDDRKKEIQKKNIEIELNKTRIQNAQQMMLDGGLDAQDYREIKARYEPEIATLKRELLSYNSINIKLDEYLSYALDLLQNIDKLFIDADLDGKQNLLCSIFPEKIIFDKNECRTPKLNEAVSLILNTAKDLMSKKKGLSKCKSEKSYRVIPLGFEPKTPSLKVMCSTS